MIRTPLRPLARILRARARGENPDDIEAENRRLRHEAIQDKARRRAEGRLVQSLALEAVVADHLVRDRLAAEDEAMATLKASIAARGQQTPIEVVDLGQGRYGLVSGWRRLAALHALRERVVQAGLDLSPMLYSRTTHRKLTANTSLGPRVCAQHHSRACETDSRFPSETQTLCVCWRASVLSSCMGLC